MRARNFFTNFFILVVAAVVVFVIGWVQFGIQPGTCGVMSSKTSGVYPFPIENGTFIWRWEKLIPTNVTMRLFSLTPHKSEQKYVGKLPSSALYSKLVNEESDFTYDVKMSLSLSVTSKKIVSLVQKNEISSQDDLDAYLENKAKIASKLILDGLLSEKNSMTAVPKALDSAALEKLKSDNDEEFNAITFQSVECVVNTLPDMELYGRAKMLYAEYEKELEAEFKARAGEQVSALYEEDRSIRRLEQYAQLIKKYPNLKDLGNVKEISKVLDSVAEDGTLKKETAAPVENQESKPEPEAAE